MHGDPAELDADDRQESRAQQNQHAGGAEPVEQAIGQRVPDDAAGGRRGRLSWRVKAVVTVGRLLCLGARNNRYKAWPTISTQPRPKNTHSRSHDMPWSTSRP